MPLAAINEMTSLVDAAPPQEVGDALTFTVGVEARLHPHHPSEALSQIVEWTGDAVIPLVASNKPLPQTPCPLSMSSAETPLSNRKPPSVRCQMPTPC